MKETNTQTSKEEKVIIETLNSVIIKLSSTIKSNPKKVQKLNKKLTITYHSNNHKRLQIKSKMLIIRSLFRVRERPEFSDEEPINQVNEKFILDGIPVEIQGKSTKKKRKTHVRNGDPCAKE